MQHAIEEQLTAMNHYRALDLQLEKLTAWEAYQLGRQHERSKVYAEGYTDGYRDGETNACRRGLKEGTEIAHEAQATTRGQV